jgi:glycosyltransferase involved in cell wall biosynthesis
MPTRVLRVIARMNIGGPAIHASLLTRGLDPARYESWLVTGVPSENEGDYLAFRGQTLDRVVTIPGLGREIQPWRDWRAYRTLQRVIREVKPTIVHTHTAKAGVLGRLAARRLGVPIVIHTFHGHVLKGYFSRSKERMFVQAERIAARASTRLVTVSDVVRDELLERGIGRPDQYDVIRLGFDLAPFIASGRLAGAFRTELGVDRATPLIAIVARLVPIKAHETFLEMAAHVAARHPTARFVIVGDGERRAALEGEARARGLGGRVHFLGWRADLDKIYADVNVVVLTSRNEGSPVALIEAMACSRPVVATRAGGVAELVGDAGLLRDVGDAVGLADDVSRLIADPALAGRLGEAGRIRVVPLYSQERLLADIDRLYRRCLTERNLS